MKKTMLNFAACQLLAMVTCWLTLSFLQVITQNCGGSPEYSWWNFFLLLAKL